MATPILQLSGISYAYPGGGTALSEIDLTLSAGEQVALLGANGAGKSTLFLLCNGVLMPHKGQILLDGAPVGRREKELRRLRQAIGLVFQNPEDQMIGSTVRSEISFGPMNLQLSEEEVTAAVDRAAADMNLEALVDKPPQYLSGGEKKRVTIADILAMRSRMMLLDEPTASLDPAHTVLLEETLARLHQQGLGLLISTHDVGFAWRWARRAVVLAGGRILRDGPVEEIFSDRNLLSAAGLQMPELFAVSQLLFPSLPPERYPRTVGALQTMLQENHL